MMFLALLVICCAFPIIDLILVFRLSPSLGGVNCVAIIILTGLLGLSIIKRQRARVFRWTQDNMAQGRPSVVNIGDAALRVAAGALLILPGFMTDAIGLLLLLPPVRRLILRHGGQFIKGRATFVSWIARPDAPPFTDAASFSSHSPDSPARSTNRLMKFVPNEAVDPLPDSPPNSENAS